MQIAEVKTVKHEMRRRNAGSKTRVFVWPVGESVKDNFVNRRSRPAQYWKPIAEKVARLFDLTPDRIGWSQKAGCACGCSPGFVLYGVKDFGQDIHVDVTA